MQIISSKLWNNKLPLILPITYKITTFNMSIKNNTLLSSSLPEYNKISIKSMTGKLTTLNNELLGWFNE